MAQGEKTGGRTRKLARGQKNQLADSFRLTWQSLETIRLYWRPLTGILLVYMILHLIFASGLSNLNRIVSNIRLDLEAANNGVRSALGGLGDLLASGGGGSDASSVMQSILLLIVSLAIIWALRQLLADNKVTVKAAYYLGMAPLIPFVLVIAVILIQLLPIIFASILVTVLSSVFGSSAVLTILYVAIFVALASLSVYLICSSVLALYIVTLPEMQPRVALRSAKNLVQFRRLAIIRRQLFLPLFIILVMSAIMLPLLLFAAVLVAPFFYVLSALAILYSHTYLYNLYRDLLE